MNNPYAAALKMNRRNLDEIRVEVASKEDTIEQISSAKNAIDTEIQHEIDLTRAADHHFIDFGAYALRKRSEHMALSTKQAEAEAELDELRMQTEEAFGSYKAVSQASGRWGDAQSADAARREQQFMDEIAARSVRAL